MFICFLISFLLPTTNVEKVMQEFHELKTQKEEIAFMKMYQTDVDPSVQAYVLGLQLRQAKYALSPIKKISIFKKYNAKLNKLILNQASNAHLRYMRLVVQENIPSFLQSETIIAKDKMFLKNYKLSHKSSRLTGYITLNTSL